MVKYCSNCGKEVSDDTKFCSECGKDLVESNQPKTQEKYSNKKFFGYLCIGIIVIFLISALAGFVLTIFDDGSNNSTDDSDGYEVMTTMINLNYTPVDFGTNDDGNYFESYIKDNKAIVAQFLDNGEEAKDFEDIGFTQTSYNNINGYGGEVKNTYEFVYDLKNGTTLMFVVDSDNINILNNIVKDY